MSVGNTRLEVLRLLLLLLLLRLLLPRTARAFSAVLVLAEDVETLVPVAPVLLRLEPLSLVTNEGSSCDGSPRLGVRPPVLLAAVLLTLWREERRRW